MTGCEKTVTGTKTHSKTAMRIHLAGISASRFHKVPDMPISPASSASARWASASGWACVASVRRTWLPGTLRSWPSPPPPRPTSRTRRGHPRRRPAWTPEHLPESHLQRPHRENILLRYRRKDQKNPNQAPGTELLGELIVIGVGGQVLELSGYFLLFGFLTSAAHLTP